MTVQEGAARAAKGGATAERRLSWGWWWYHRMGWVGEDGRKLYRAKLAAEVSTGEGEELTLEFWSCHPVKDLRRACALPRTAAEVVDALKGTEGTATA